MIQALFWTLAFLGLWLQMLADTLVNWRRAQGCTCSKGRLCAKCLGESEAIRPGGGS